MNKYLKYKFMNDKLISKNTENDEFALNTEEIDYKNLISKLKDISATITLLEKLYQDKF